MSAHWYYGQKIVWQRSFHLRIHAMVNLCVTKVAMSFDNQSFILDDFMILAAATEVLFRAFFCLNYVKKQYGSRFSQ